MLIFEAALTGARRDADPQLPERAPERAARASLLGVAAGLLFTTTHVAVKALTGKIDTTVAEVLLSPYLYVAIAGRRGRVLRVGALAPDRARRAGDRGDGDRRERLRHTRRASSCSATRSAPTRSTSACGLLAFLLVIGAAALIPAPVRAAAS